MGQPSLNKPHYTAGPVIIAVLQKWDSLVFWLQFRSLFYFNNCDSAKQPSPREIAMACLV